MRARSLVTVSLLVAFVIGLPAGARLFQQVGRRSSAARCRDDGGIRGVEEGSARGR